MNMSFLAITVSSIIDKLQDGLQLVLWIDGVFIVVWASIFLIIYLTRGMIEILSKDKTEVPKEKKVSHHDIDH